MTKTFVMEWYELKRVRPRRLKGQIASAATRICDLCSALIDGSGGPGEGSICTRCARILKEGQLRGVVEWKDQVLPPTQQPEEK